MKLFKNFAIISSLTIVSRVSGMIREIFVSHILGASWMSDAFVVALRFPNFFRQFFGEGAFNAAFVPQFSGILAKEGKKNAADLARNIFSFLTIVLLIFCIIVIIFMPSLIQIIAPGFSETPERLQLCITLVRITFPYLFFVSLSALLSGVLNAFDKFAIAAAIPITANVFMISGLATYDWIGISPVMALSTSLTLSGVAQLLILYFAVKKNGFDYLLVIPKLRKPAIKILKLMIPGSISTGVMQINLLLSMTLASMLPTGSLSYLFYADRLNQLPLALFGISIGTALLPQLSKLWRSDKKEEALALQESALLLALQLAIPASVALFCLAHPFIALLFGHGKFGANEIAKTAPALAAFALGLPAYVMGKVFTTTFFACEDTKTPVKIAIITVILNLIFTLIFMRYYLHVGMAFATSLSAWCNICMLAFILHKRNLFLFTKRLGVHFLKIIALSFFMGGIIVVLSQNLLIENASLWQLIQNLTIIIFSGLIFYGAMAYKLGFVSIIK